MADVTQGDALAVVAAESPESVKLLGDILAANEREATWINGVIREGIERERDEWKARALEAERHLEWITRRFEGLLAPPPQTWNPDDMER